MKTVHHAHKPAAHPHAAAKHAPLPRADEAKPKGLTEADAKADIAGTPRPDNPTPAAIIVNGRSIKARSGLKANMTVAEIGAPVVSLKCGDKEWKKADAEIHVEDGQVFVAA